MFIGNSADEIILQRPDGSIEDQVFYDGGPSFPDPTGASMVLSDASVDNNVASNWSESTVAYGGGDLGTPNSGPDGLTGGGGDGGGGDDGGGDDDGICTNCPEVTKVADSSAFVDSEYYAPVISEVDAATGITAIKGALTSVISANFNSLSYTEAWTVLTESDQDPENTDNVILLYSGKSIPKSENASGTFANEDDFWNREHVWPNSHGFADDGDRNLPPVLEAFSDVHHLRPTDRSINASRGNLDFDESDGPLPEAPANSFDSDSFEPRDEVKGDVARMMLYMDTRYEGIDDVTPDLMLVDAITSTGVPLLGKLCTLLAWHNGDPVSEFEQNRNNVLYEYQGNRNPYVDHPEWVELLYPAATCGDDDGGGDDGGDDGDAPINIFISEYIEGGSNNKAIEIYNNSSQDLDLSAANVALARFSNGSTSGTNISLTGTIPANGTYVIVNTSANADFKARAQQESGSVNHNGDDAYTLSVDGAVVDSFGQVGTDPGSRWGSGDVTSQNDTLVRKPSIFTGDTVIDDAFDPADEWIGLAQDTFSELGQHEIDNRELFFSEYIEGSSSNKALEIYNPNGIDIDLAEGSYSVELYSNGRPLADGPTNSVNLSGTIAGGDVYVIANASAVAAILDEADITSTVTFFNGDDALVLSKDGVPIDSIGQVGTDPGSAWTGDGVSTANNTIIRKASIGAGDPIVDDAFDPSVEWDGFPSNTFDDIGKHTSGAGGGDDPDPIDFGVCLDPATLIHDIQGSGSVSPLDGSEVIIEGVVIADYQADGQLGGFFVQEEDAEADADPASSEGIFVFDTANNVNVGDVVRLQGTVGDFFGLTQISAVSGQTICATGASVTASSLTLPISSLDAYESVEGMLVAFSQPLVVTEHFNLDRFGQMTLSSERTYQFTHSNVPDAAGYATHLANKELNQINLDDAMNSQNPDPNFYLNTPTPAENTIRGGSIADVSGVMSYSFGEYVIQPIDEIVFTDVNPRTTEPEDVGGNFKIAGINVLNFFTTLDANGAVCGPSDLGCRGADSAEEFTRQKAKIVAALSIIDADILGLVELENNASESLSNLVSGLNEVAGAGTYAFIDTGTIGGDAIKVGLVYKPASATPTGAFAILDSSVDPLFIDNKNRPTLAQTFITDSGETLTIAVNHLKSKGSDCDDVGDPDLNDGQANCAGTRANAATALVNWLATDPTASGDEDYLIVGDLNAYAMEDAITNITDAGYTNLITAFGGSNAYSFVFDGELGYLDHALASASLTEKVTDITEWHINSDEPDAFDYNTSFKSEAQIAEWFAPDAYRMSDHDPVIIGFDFPTAAVVGDYDGDGDLDMFDLRAIIRALRSGSLSLDYDADGNGRVDIRDVRVLYSQCTRARCAVN